MSRSSAPRSPAFIATVVALPVVLLVGILVAIVLSNRTPNRTPLTLNPATGPAATGPECARLMAALPANLGGYPTAEITAPAPATKAWQHDGGGEPIVLRCGLPRPTGFTVTSGLQIVDGVQWFEASGADVPGSAANQETSTWYAVDRGIYLELTTPSDSGPTPIQAISDTISATMPARPIDPAPPPN